MSQYDRMVASQREYLPKKSQKPGNPSFLWIHPPTHDSIQSKENRLRIHFVKALNSVASLHENTYALGFKKIWNPSDPSLYNRDERQFTADGLITYWKAVDATFKYFDTLLLNKKMKKENQPAKKNSFAKVKYDKYHWRR